MRSNDTSRVCGVIWVFWIVAALVVPAPVTAQTDTGTCLECHDDPELIVEYGNQPEQVVEDLMASVHRDLDCIDCHSQPADYEDIPHFEHYVPPDCADCHDDAVDSYRMSFHSRAHERGNPQAPNCAGCHGADGDPHRIRGLGTRTAEEACRSCHSPETISYDDGVHAEAAALGLPSPGCSSCHPTHGPDLPPAAGAVNSLCETCHPGAMEDVQRGDHLVLGETLAEVMNCASCHDVHGTHKPHLSARVAEACHSCHEKDREAFVGTVHEAMFAEGRMNCVTCHSTHKDEEDVGRFDTGCGACHSDIEEEYRGSVHRLGRLRGSEGAATCADCHQGHHIRAEGDAASQIHPENIPDLCGTCHGDVAVVTSDYVILPVSLPNYLASVHGVGWTEGKKTAVCTDCHGTHDLKTAQDPESSINRFHLAETCGQCHRDIALEYENSIHGKAVALGIADSPTCTDCHDEHLIQKAHDPTARVSPEHRARELCGDCHTNPELVSKYGIPGGEVESYLDSYHGWAVDRGSDLVATCTDCHNVHEIRSTMDPASSVHPDRLVETCGRCHEGSNPEFALSYTHVRALQARGIHGWVRLVYIALIAGVLGGMALHNLIVARHEILRHFRHRKSEPYVVRWQKAERVQHLVLLISFAGLAITGFALRFPDAWWVNLIGLGGREVVRADLHRALATIMVVDAVYHMVWVLVTRRGRWGLSGITPRMSDFVHAFQNMAFHLGWRKERPAFGAFDYTQKAEYWAVIWGTAVMGLTGFVLWFPTLATGWLPAWSVRVAEVVHFYEAILAVAAIFIWHLFYVIFMPSDYPMSTIWLNGRMPADEWKEMHRAQYEEEGDSSIKIPETSGKSASE